MADAGGAGAAADERSDGTPSACLLLVCGLPGCGKTSFCKVLLARAAEDPCLLGSNAEWHHICYDEIEADLRGPAGDFDPSAWQAARERCMQEAERLLAERAQRAVLLLDDNMYYRSMRKRWYHFARERGCAYRQVFLQAPQEVCLERNDGRPPASQVPAFSILHMAEVFEWPRDTGETWEAQPCVTTVLEADSLSTDHQVEGFVSSWAVQVHIPATGGGLPEQLGGPREAVLGPAAARCGARSARGTD
uniref:L-seryl-tRNA(Sec) kinase n=1 Tax=Alexandrium monilatum TaxID=311494 RepID=A0A6T1G554_9DINO